MQRENSKYAQSLNTLKRKFGSILFFSSISTHIHKKRCSVCALLTHRWMYVLVNIHWIRFYSSCPVAEPLCIQHIFHNNNSTVFTIFLLFYVQPDHASTECTPCVPYTYMTGKIRFAQYNIAKSV